jgi:hypothetical protein
MRNDSHMSDILADYREWRQQQAARVSTHSDGCHMWHKDCMIHRLAAALAAEQAKRATSKAEIDALEYVVEEGRIACKEDYGILRSWLCRLRPALESTPSEPSTPGEGTRQAGCTLTDAEREALEIAVEYVGSAYAVEIHAATLRGLLERTR